MLVSVEVMWVIYQDPVAKAPNGSGHNRNPNRTEADFGSVPVRFQDRNPNRTVGFTRKWIKMDPVIKNGRILAH